MLFLKIEGVYPGHKKESWPSRDSVMNIRTRTEREGGPSSLRSVTELKDDLAAQLNLPVGGVAVDPRDNPGVPDRNIGGRT